MALQTSNQEEFVKFADTLKTFGKPYKIQIFQRQ